MIMLPLVPRLSKPKKRNPLNLAKTHYLYTPDGVIDLYGINRNTLMNWIKSGLPVIDGEVRLVRGCDLNEFHRDRKAKAKTPFSRYELNKFHCLHRLSLVDNEFTVDREQTGRIYVQATCPECEKIVGRYLIQEDLDQIDEMRKSKTPIKSQHYNVSTNYSAFVQNRPQTHPHVVPANELAVYRYQFHIQERVGNKKTTIDAALRSIRTFQRFIGMLPFEKVSEEQIKKFKELYEEGKNDLLIRNEQSENNERASRCSSTIVHCFLDLKSFYTWLQKQAKYRKKISPDLPECFNPSNEHMRIASAPTEKQVPTFEEVRHIILSMPTDSKTDRRDQALVAFLLLSGMRDGAVVSLKLKHVFVEKKEVFQDASEIKTKNSKTMRTWWFPVGQDIADIVVNWIAELRAEGAKDDDPIFPQTPKIFALHSTNRPWASATPLRKIVKNATRKAGVKEFRVHAIRSTLAILGDEVCKGRDAERKAWSQNLGHEKVETTATYYGKLDTNRQRELMTSMWDEIENPHYAEIQDLLRNVPAEKHNAVVTILKALS